MMNTTNKIKTGCLAAEVVGVVGGLWSYIAQWVCLMGLLQPDGWMSAARTARWAWVINASFYFVCSVFALIMMAVPLLALRALSRELQPEREAREDENSLAMPPMAFAWPSPASVLWTGGVAVLSTLSVLVALLMDQIEAALLLDYGWSAVSALSQLLLAPGEAKEESVKARRIEQMNNCYTLLLLPVVLLVLHFHSVPGAVALLPVQIVCWFIFSRLKNLFSSASPP